MSAQLNHCPCLSGHAFKNCCQPIISGQTPASTAEALMRSRYTAFATAAIPHLLASSAKEKHDNNEAKQLEGYCAQTHWLGLKILDTKAGQESDERGSVEFVAFFEQGNGIEQLHERSRFEKRDGLWIYTDGDILPPVKFGRNDACWCGSGKKLKKCHGR